MAFVGGQLINGTGEEPVQDSVVAVENGRIVYAGAKCDKTPDLEGFEIRDISGKTVIAVQHAGQHYR